MSESGRGEVEYVALNDDGSAAARRFHERVRESVVTDISIDWSGLPVFRCLPEAHSGFVLRQAVNPPGRIRVPVAASCAEECVSRRLFARFRVDFPEADAQNSVSRRFGPASALTS